LVAVLGIALLAGMSRARAADPANSCSYGTGGIDASGLCWLDLTGYEDAAALSAAGQEFTEAIPGGYTLSFTLKRTATAGNPAVAAVAVPEFSGAALGNPKSGQYVGIAGKPGLYAQSTFSTSNHAGTWTATLSNLKVVNSAGEVMTGWTLAAADAETTNVAERLKFSSGGEGWRLLNSMPSPNSPPTAACGEGLVGIGTATVTCAGGKGANVGAVVLATSGGPSQVAVAAEQNYTNVTGGGGQSGFAFAIGTANITLAKAVASRIAPTDQFTVSVADEHGHQDGTATTTGTGTTASTGSITVIPGSPYSLTEAAAGTTDLAEYDQSLACSNSAAGSTTTLPGALPGSVTPATGDDISCTVTNTAIESDLSIEKTASTSELIPGSELTYELKVENHGPSPAKGVEVTDPIPAETSFVSASAGCAEAAATVTCELAELAPGESHVFEVTVLVSPTVGASIVNTAKVGSETPDPEPENNESSVTTPESADLSIVKTATPSPAIPGEDVTYELLVENHGPSNAKNVEVTDTLPAGLAFVEASEGCAEAAGTVTCELATLKAGAAHTFTIKAHVGAGVTGTLANLATVGSETPDPEPGNNESEIETPTTPEADLSIEKTASTSELIPGSELTYELKIENHGPSAAKNVEVSDPIPAETSFVSASAGCTEAAGTVTCGLSELAPGESHVFEVTVLVSPTVGASIVNTATVGSETPDPEPGNNESSVTTPEEADLSIEKKAAPSPAVPGEDLTYELLVENHGPTNAKGIEATDTLPAGLTFVEASAGCTEAVGTVTCDLATLAAGGTHTFTIKVHVAPTVTGNLANVATVGSETPDPEPGNNESEIETPTTPEADLSIVKTATPSPAIPGEDVTYELKVENHGPSAAEGVEVTDTLPAGLTFVEASAGCIEVAGTVICELAELAPGESHSFTVKAHVAPTFAGTLANLATVGSETPDPEPGNNESEIETPTAPEADLSVEKTASPSPAVPGEDIEYTLKVENHGPSSAKGVEVSDTLPAGLTFLEASEGCTEAAGKVTCGLAGLLVGESHSFTIKAHVGAGVTGPIANLATVGSETPDPEPGNNESEIETPTTPEADLSIEKTTSLGTVVPGEDIEYSIKVENHGPSVAKGVEATDALPAGLTFVEASTGCTEAAGTVTCEVAELAPGESHSFTVKAHVGAAVTGTVANVGKVGSETPDPEPGNNESKVETPTGPEADLSIEKTASSSELIPGGELTYSLKIENHGPSAAKNVEVSDPIPAETSFVSGSAGCTEAAGTVTCELAELAPGESHLFEVTVLVSPTVGASIVNTAKVGSETPDPEPGNNESSVTTPEEADLSIEKTATPSPAIPGEDIEYSLKVENHGPSNAKGVEVTDNLPAGLAFVEASSGCTEATGTVTCELANLAAGASHTFTIKAHVGSAVTGTLANVATVSSDSPDPEPGNNESKVETPTNPEADLSVEKTASPSPVVPGKDLTYTLKVENHGPSTAREVEVTDTLPAGLTFVEASAGCTEAAGTVTCELAELAPGESHSFTVKAHVGTAVTGNLANVATVDSETPDPEPGNNESEIETPTTPEADLSIEKTASSSELIPGSELTYSLKVENHGPSAAKNVEVSDPIPAETSFVSASAGCAEAAGTVTCELAELAPGESHVFEVTVLVSPTVGASIVNTATVGSETPDPEPGNNESSVTTPEEADLSIVKTASPSPVVPGQDVEYSLKVENHGPSNALHVKVTDALPAGLTFVSASEGCAEATGTVLCELTTLSAGGSHVFTVKAHVDPAVSGAIANVATVSSPTPDPEPGNNESKVETPTSPEADLSIVKSASSSVVQPGGQVTYTLAVVNHGPSQATGVTVADSLPAGLNLVTAVPSQGSCAGGPPISCSLGTLVPGGAAQVVVTADVSKTYSGTLTNSAKVSGDQPDPEPGNNTSTVEVKVPSTPPPTPTKGYVDLKVVKTVDHAKVAEDGSLVYTITVKNQGTETATEVHLTDTSSHPLKFTSIAPSQGKCKPSFPYDCRLGSIAPGKTVKLTVDADASEVGDETNTASATSAQPDVSPRNNVDAARTSVRPRLRLVKTGPAKVRAGGRVVFHLKVTNLAATVALHVKVCDRLPAGLVFVGARPRAVLSAGSYCWAVGTLGPRASKALSLTARVLRGAKGKLRNTAVATSPGARAAAAHHTVRVLPLPTPPTPVTG